MGSARRCLAARSPWMARSEPPPRKKGRSLKEAAECARRTTTDGTLGVSNPMPRAVPNPNPMKMNASHRHRLAPIHHGLHSLTVDQPVRSARKPRFQLANGLIRPHLATLQTDRVGRNLGAVARDGPATIAFQPFRCVRVLPPDTGGCLRRHAVTARKCGVGLDLRRVRASRAAPEGGQDDRRNES